MTGSAADLIELVVLRVVSLEENRHALKARASGGKTKAPNSCLLVDQAGISCRSGWLGMPYTILIYEANPTTIFPGSGIK
ncbi:hypothetical protein JAO76_13610 [Pontibacter sp. BT310]|uniref:Transposase IS701-like DDE domain-containing protein n=1 Tax=Pontibacter populi TaxID=890055 RepID=A0ABS6XFZ2_9BACT|nr:MULTISPECIES: hypothetical protein [Pontibacter]MBJ6119241.1 hypothetical protein [Pontibacter sp. BT310]MBR0571669.1 hypothetical protein [Microvirga sp. STS03]MBW3366095.1 hypothetical protein [Pontibacter populi]